MKRIVIATLKVVGFHVWAAPIEGVEYLGEKHRHLFTFRVEVSVDHGDRDVEYHTLQRQMRAELPSLERLDAQHRPYEYDFDGQSCEHLAERMGKALKLAGILGLHAVEVWEDDECGSRVEWP